MAKDPAFPFYAQDFLTGVMHLDFDLRGRYITLIAYQWQNGDKIPKKRLGFLVGFTWESMDDDLKEKFEDCGDYILNKRLLEERQKRIAFKEKQSQNGRRGGRPSKNKDLKKPNESQKKPLESESEKEDEDEDKKENKTFEKSEKLLKSIEIEIHPTFDDFWNEYDKKIGSKDKLKVKWIKLSQKSKEEIMAYIPNYKLSQPDKRFRKNPETFLNNESWNDELISPNGKQSNSQTGQEYSAYKARIAETLSGS